MPREFAGTMTPYGLGVRPGPVPGSLNVVNRLIAGDDSTFPI